MDGKRKRLLAVFRQEAFFLHDEPWAGYTSPIGHHTSAVLVSLTGLI
ncbi:hypothetical protein V7021_12555 [Cytobacillus firmus]